MPANQRPLLTNTGQPCNTLPSIDYSYRTSHYTHTCTPQRQCSTHHYQQQDATNRSLQPAACSSVIALSAYKTLLRVAGQFSCPRSPIYSWSNSYTHTHHQMPKRIYTQWYNALLSPANKRAHTHKRTQFCLSTTAVQNCTILHFKRLLPIVTSATPQRSSQHRATALNALEQSTSTSRVHTQRRIAFKPGHSHSTRN